MDCRQMTAPEKPDALVVGVQGCLPFQFLASLLLVRRGWFANHLLERSPGVCGRDAALRRPVGAARQPYLRASCPPSLRVGF